MPEEHDGWRRRLGKRRWRVILGAFIFVAILAAVVPPVVVITVKGEDRMGPKSGVFVPLYVYPAPGAWDPLEEVVRTHPDLNFTVVINPGSGPGPESLPDANYTREIPILAAFDNVRLLGYVATGYATRDSALVRRDIETYAAWPSLSTRTVAVNGIFFDETPQQFDSEALAYFENLTALVKESKGFGGDNLVVHNPGAVPDPRYLSTADLTLVFEDTYNAFVQRHDAKMLEDIGSDRTKLGVIIHSIPDNIRGKQLRSLVKDTRYVAGEVFVTHLSSDYYARFDPNWAEFIDLMAES